MSLLSKWALVMLWVLYCFVIFRRIVVTSKYWLELHVFVWLMPSVLWRCWLGGRKGIWPVKNLSGWVLAWLSVWNEMQTCIWPSWCHCHSLCHLQVNSALHPSGVAKSSTSFDWGKGGNVTSAGWQVTLCDPMWHVSSRSSVAILRTAIHLLLTYLLTVSCSSKIQIGFTFLVPAYPGNPGQRAVKRVCVCLCDYDTDLLTVSESATEPPQEEGSNLNSPKNLSLEATFVNHNFSQQVLKIVSCKSKMLDWFGFIVWFRSVIYRIV